MATMKCSRCGSEKVMTDLRIRDRSDSGVGQDLEVEVQRDPRALIFKQAQREALRATVCGECGNVGLSVKNPQALWKAYTERKDSEDLHKLNKYRTLRWKKWSFLSFKPPKSPLSGGL